MDTNNIDIKVENTTREALPSDIPSLINFQIAMAKETENIDLDHVTVSFGVKAVFEDQTKGKYYVIESEGEVVACLMTTFEWSDWRNGTVLWIQSVYVSEKYRGKGLFKQIYEHVKQVVENTEGYRGIRLYVDKGNTSAISVYNKLGMTNQHYEMFEWMKNNF